MAQAIDTPTTDTSTRTSLRTKRVLRSTQSEDFVYPSLHNYPVEGKKAKDLQKKEKQSKMRSQPECLNWDYKHSTGGDTEPCDVQFYTKRLMEWKQICSTYYGVELDKPVCFKSIGGGDQLIVSDSVTINFYNSNIILVQGRDFVEWGRQTFHSLQDKLDATAADTVIPTVSVDTEQTASDNNHSLLMPLLVSTPSKLSLLHEESSTRDSLYEPAQTGNVLSDNLRDSTFNQTVDQSHTNSQNESSDGTTSELDTASSPGNHFTRGNIDSMLASTDCSIIPDCTPDCFEVVNQPITQINDIARKLDELLANSLISLPDSELESERDKVRQLKRDMKLMKSHLSDKDDEIKTLEREMKTCKQVLEKQAREISKLQKYKKDMGQSKLIDDNSSLRVENRQLRERADHIAEELAIMTAKYESLRHQPQEQAASRPASPWISLHPELSLCKGGARPKIRSSSNLSNSSSALPTSKGCSRPKQPSPDRRPLPTPRKTARPQPGRKAKMTVIGASNVRGLSSNLQTESFDTVTFTNPGRQLHQMKNRVSNMVAKDTDVVVMHLGTNDALNAKSDQDCFLNASKALDTVEGTHSRNNPDVPLLVCAVPPTKKRYAQHRVNCLNQMFKKRCQQSKSLHFVDPRLTHVHLKKDGVHLSDEGKDKLASVILSAANDLQSPPFHNGHQKIVHQQNIPVHFSVRQSAPQVLNPWF